MSLSGTVTSSSIDARGTSGIARSGLLIRASSAVSTTGSVFNPRSFSFVDALTWTSGKHTFKFGGEYRFIAVRFPVPGSTEITYNSINDFIDNRPNAVAVALESPVFKPQQYYADWIRAGLLARVARLSLELGLRYDFYSVVKEKNGLAKPFFVEDNAFGATRTTSTTPTRTTFRLVSRRRSSLIEKTVMRGGFGLFYGPGQFEDRIQPIENYIERRRVGAADIPNNGLAYPFSPRRRWQRPADSRLYARSAGRVQRAVRRQYVARIAR